VPFVGRVDALTHPPKDATMGTLTVTEFISVDGVIDSPGGEPG
jgi:hypothetical protein